MSRTSPISAVVLLVGADDAAATLLRPAAEVLTSFRIQSETVIMPLEWRALSLPPGVSAMIVASPDGVLPATLAAGHDLPVIRVPMENGAASLDDGNGNLPAGSTDGVFATMAIGEAGAKNAALFVVASLAVEDAGLAMAWAEFRARQTDAVLRHPPLSLED